MTKHDWIGVFMICFATSLFGFAAGYVKGSPINNITEIVWIDSHEKDWGPALEEGFNLVCRLVPSK